VPYLKVGWFIRFDPAEIAAWLDDARHPHVRHGRLDAPKFPRSRGEAIASQL
jgi:hypothetical protein